MKKLKSFCFLLCFIGFGSLYVSAQEDYGKKEPTDPVQMFRQGQDKTEAEHIVGPIYYAEGFANTFMIVSSEGNMIIDTSMPFNAKHHKDLLQKVDKGPIKYILLTHGHRDHRGGVPEWKEKETQVIAHENFTEFRHYQERLSQFFNLRGNAQFNTRNPAKEPKGNFEAEVEADVFVKDSLVLNLDSLEIHIHHAPGETYDHLNVWIPTLKTAFVGDNFYRSFPNIYTLRGTKPRWALDYVQSLNRVISWEPEVLIPSHGPQVKGKKEILRRLKKYRDAILYVHDETVKGMNEGKSVEQLMKEIKIPSDLDIGSTYGKISWSVRGIYEGYSGWFDANPTSMYSDGPAIIYPDLVGLMGGMEVLHTKIKEYLKQEDYMKAMHLADIGLATDGQDVVCLQSKLQTFKALEKRAQNSNERGWLLYGIREIERKLKELGDN